uniref:Uncharacterized protein n=1 Tax=Lepeophtheirus salmonis TaxID=72036 RepID=A0A0K2TJB7_LEPSM
MIRASIDTLRCLRIVDCITYLQNANKSNLVLIAQRVYFNRTCKKGETYFSLKALDQVAKATVSLRKKKGVVLQFFPARYRF